MLTLTFSQKFDWGMCGTSLVELYLSKVIMCLVVILALFMVTVLLGIYKEHFVDEDMLELVFENGKLLRDESMTEIRAHLKSQQ